MRPAGRRQDKELIKYDAKPVKMIIPAQGRFAQIHERVLRSKGKKHGKAS